MHTGGTHGALIASLGLPWAAWHCPRSVDTQAEATDASPPDLLSGLYATLDNSTHPLVAAFASHAVTPGSVPRLQSSSLSTPPEQAQPLAALAPSATSTHDVCSCIPVPHIKFQPHYTIYWHKIILVPMHGYLLLLFEGHSITVERGRHSHITKTHTGVVCYSIAPALKVRHPLVVLPICECKISMRTCM